MPNIAKIINNKIYPMDTNIISSKIQFITEQDEMGWNILRRGLTFIFIVACKKIDSESDVKIMHSLNKGLYCKVNSSLSLKAKDIKEKMQEIILADLPFKNIQMPKNEVLELLKKESKKKDKYFLFSHKDTEIVELNELDGIYDYFYGILPPSTKHNKVFDLVDVKEKNCFILLPPERSNPEKVIPLQNSEKLCKVYDERKKWAEISGVNLLSDLNKIVSDKNHKELIEITEALHERKIADIAEEITKSNKKIILIAGPSSSGKTTFCHRLSIQLKTYNIVPKSISVDDYFKNNEELLPEEDGKPDFESINTIDLELLNNHLKKLLDGEEIDSPTFNFKTGKKEWLGNKLKLNKNEVLILEGLHCLNPAMTSKVKEDDKFYIYISAMTQVNLDNHNRISTTDLRFCRRLIRDYYYRGVAPQQTFELWNNVRKGERNNIFPFQEKAQCLFNSELSYEINVLKKFALPLLNNIDKHSEYYAKAQELIEMFSYVKTLDDLYYIPPNSILKEFLPKE